MNFKLIKRLLGAFGLLLPLLFWASPAFAGGTLNPGGGNNAWELYVFGNGAVIYSILNSVSAMVNDPGYHDLLEFVGVLGIFGTAIMVGFDASKMPKMLAFVLGAFFVLYVSLDVTANIMVEDPINNYTNVATGVPAVVGIPAAVISDVGHWLTSKVEQDFSLPNSLTVTGGDQFNLANSLMQSATQAQILDPYLKSSFAAYISNCVMPELANGTLNAETLLTSTDFLQAIQVTNQAILTPYYSSAWPNGQLVDCTGAWTDLSGTLNNEASTLLTANSSQWGGNGVSIISSGLTSATQWLSNNTANQSADQTILQTATLNMFNGTAMQEGAALTGNNGVLTSMAIAQAEQSQESSWYTGAQVFNNLMGYIYSVLQAFLFAITPLLMAATLIPGFGLAVLKNFFQVLLWLILWQPMLAIVSYIVALYGQSAYGGVMANSGGITDLNLPVISQQSSHMVLAAGFLATMVPIIAWGLVKGSLAFSDFIMAAGGGAMASSAGAMAATGNVSLDNQSMNNDAFNSKNFAHSVAVGDQSMGNYQGMGNPSTFKDYGGLGLRDAAGAITETVTSGSSSSLGTTGSSGTSASTSASQAAAEATAKRESYNSALGSAASQANDYNDRQSTDYNASIGQSVGHTIGSAINASTDDGASKYTDVSTAESVTTGLAGVGLSRLMSSGAAFGSKLPSIARALSDGKSVDEVASENKDISKAAIASFAKLQKAAKSSPGLMARAKSMIESTAKTVKGSSAETAALVAGGAVLAVLGLAGPDEVVAAVAGGGELVDAAMPAATKLIEGTAEGGTEGSLAASEGGEGVEGLLHTPEDGPIPANDDTPPGAKPADDTKPADKGKKPGKDDEEKGGKKDSPLTKVLQAAPTGMKTDASTGQGQKASANANIKNSGDNKLTTGREAKRGAAAKRGISYGTAVKAELKAMAQSGTDASHQAGVTLQRLNALSSQISMLDTAARSKSSGYQISIAETPSSVDAESLTSTGTDVDPGNAPQNFAPAVNQRLAEDRQVTGPGLAVQPGSQTAAATQGVVNNANAAVSQALAQIKAHPNQAASVLSNLKNKLAQDGAGEQQLAAGINTQAGARIANYSNQTLTGAKKTLTEAQKRLSQANTATTHASLLGNLFEGNKIMMNMQNPKSVLSSAAKAGADLTKWAPSDYSRMFTGSQGQANQQGLEAAARKYDVPVAVLAGIAATESSGTIPAPFKDQYGQTVAGMMQVATSNPEVAHELETNNDYSFDRAAQKLSAFEKQYGSLAGGLAAYGGWAGNTKAPGAQVYIAKVSSAAAVYVDEQPDNQPKSLSN